jgi:hypothetical protein
MKLTIILVAIVFVGSSLGQNNITRPAATPTVTAPSTARNGPTAPSTARNGPAAPSTTRNVPTTSTSTTKNGPAPAAAAVNNAPVASGSTNRSSATSTSTTFASAANRAPANANWNTVSTDLNRCISTGTNSWNNYLILVKNDLRNACGNIFSITKDFGTIVLNFAVKTENETLIATIKEIVEDLNNGSKACSDFGFGAALVAADSRFKNLTIKYLEDLGETRNNSKCLSCWKPHKKDVCDQIIGLGRDVYEAVDPDVKAVFSPARTFVSMVARFSNALTSDGSKCLSRVDMDRCFGRVVCSIKM